MIFPGNISAHSCQRLVSDPIVTETSHRWEPLRDSLLLEPKRILSSLLPLHKTIAAHEEESSVFMSLYVRGILTGNVKRETVRAARQCGDRMDRVLLFPPLPRHSRLPGSC